MVSIWPSNGEKRGRLNWVQLNQNGHFNSYPGGGRVVTSPPSPRLCVCNGERGFEFSEVFVSAVKSEDFIITAALTFSLLKIKIYTVKQQHFSL